MTTRALSPFVELVEAHAIEGDYSEGNEPYKVLGQVIARLQAAVLYERERAEQRGYERGKREAVEMSTAFKAGRKLGRDESREGAARLAIKVGEHEYRRGYARGVMEERERVFVQVCAEEVELLDDDYAEDTGVLRSLRMTLFPGRPLYRGDMPPGASCPACGDRRGAYSCPERP